MERRPQPDSSRAPLGRASDRSPGLVVALAVILALVWVALSGIFDPILVAWALLGIGVSVYVPIRMNVLDRESLPIHIGGGLAFRYLPWITKEIAKANWDVAKIVLDPRLPISPTMRSFRVAPRTDLGKVIYANSITLTPGTITTGIIGDTFEIHALTVAAWDGTEEGEMGRRVRELEGGE